MLKYFANFIPYLITAFLFLSPVIWAIQIIAAFRAFRRAFSKAAKVQRERRIWWGVVGVLISGTILFDLLIIKFFLQMGH